MARPRIGGSTTGGENWKPRSRGFSAASAAGEAAMRAAAAKRGIAEMRLISCWPEIVGPRLARLSRPERVRHNRGGHALGGVLIIAVSGPRASEVELEIPQIIERVNAFYGYRAVVDVKLTQAAVGPIDSLAGRTRPERGKQALPEDLAPEKRDALENLTAGVGDDALRDALTRLGANVMSSGAASTKSDPGSTH